MGWINNKIVALQNRPYEERVRLWKRTTVIIGLVMLVGLLLSFKFRGSDFTDSEALQDFWNIFKNLKNINQPSQ